MSDDRSLKRSLMEKRRRCLQGWARRLFKVPENVGCAPQYRWEDLALPKCSYVLIIVFTFRIEIMELVSLFFRAFGKLRLVVCLMNPLCPSITSLLFLLFLLPLLLLPPPPSPSSSSFSTSSYMDAHTYGAVGYDTYNHG